MKLTFYKIVWFHTSREGDEEILKELLEAGETSVDIEDQEGATPLILASIGGFISIVRILIGIIISSKN